ncbi:hypothetical protein AALP_AA6G095600 [Arabis alpina]|uniref:Formin-like protein n=1 Tax=Arabis alpina TaxID=50452 RepID=A0A087GN53_ARAAL|nr:hypothetical protein AALP_AA6G095600 [Arabis alpina]
MQSFWFTIIILLSCAPSPLSCASSATLGRRHLYDDAALPQPLTPTSPSFFPLYSSAPPPPPTFAAFPTFPANISALVLPRSPKPHPSSPTLVVPALSALLAVGTAIGLALFLYGRWRGQKRYFKDSDGASTSSHDEPKHVTTNFSVAATTSTSEVLYMGSGTCFVNSQSSPEIRPLPPLPPQPNYVPDFLSDEEDDEFFSPLASLAASETSSPYSSSRWVSPARSFSITISPVHHHSNPRYSDHLNLHSLRMFSFLNQNVGFPRISSASSSPDTCAVRTPARSSLYSSVSTSPDGFLRKFLDTSPPVWNEFSRNVKSVLLSSDSTRDFVINIGSGHLNPEFATPQHSQEAAPPPTRPPPLVPPSQSFVVQQAAKNLSFSVLPPKQLQWDRLSKELVETLFIANPNMIQPSLSNDLPVLNQENKLLDPRKAQNIATLLQLLNLTTKDVSQALLDGDCDALGAELLECLSRLAPSEQEEKKLKCYRDDSVNKLGPAERFLKELLHVPFVFKRVDALLFMANFHSKMEHLARSFGVVQAACEELGNSRMFSILLDVILKTGRKMNIITNSCGASAHAFKLDTLLKLAEVKGLDGRSSLLHFVVQEVIKSEGTVKAFEGIRNLSSELVNVKRSADIAFGALRNDILKLYRGIKNIEELLLLSEESGSRGDQWLMFMERMDRFVATAAGEIARIEAQESSTVSALEEVAEHFHGDFAEEGHTLRIFMIVRDFLSVLDKVCSEMGGWFPAM